MPNIKIFILNWNGGDILLDCIQSTLNIDYESFEVIVIDNNSSDNSINDIHEKFPQVQVISLDQNYGYSAGYKKAFESVGCSRDEFFFCPRSVLRACRETAGEMSQRLKSLLAQ